MRVQLSLCKVARCATIFFFIPLLLNAGPKLGKWFCIEAAYKDTLITDLNASITFIDANYYEADFSQKWYNGNAKALHRFSKKSDTLFTELPSGINTTYGGQSYSVGGKLQYQFMLNCPPELWIKVGQTAIGWGWPKGAKKSLVLIQTEGDTVLYLKSWDGHTRLTYTYGAKRPFHNLVTFGVRMKVQEQLGTFKPENGDSVFVDCEQGATHQQFVLHELDVEGMFQTVVDFPPRMVDSTITYRFCIKQKISKNRICETVIRKFVLEPSGQNLGAPFFDNRARKEIVANLIVANSPCLEWYPASAYNHLKNKYLVVWADNCQGDWDIVGRLLTADGHPASAVFTICRNDSTQVNPAVEFMPDFNSFMVVWEDERNGNSDVYGALISDAGQVIPVQRSLADGSFIVCNHDSSQNSPRLAYNSANGTLLCVWVDERNQYKTQYGYYTNLDIYGQRILFNGDLLTPGDFNDPKINFPVANRLDQNEYYPDVAYYGLNAWQLNEWLVVYSRSQLTSTMALKKQKGAHVNQSTNQSLASALGGGNSIWGVRIDEWGMPLDTYGRRPASNLYKAALGGRPPWLPEFPISNQAMSMYSYNGSPHVAANDLKLVPYLHKAQGGDQYSSPEFLVTWTMYDYEKSNYAGDIYYQRVAYYPDSTAARLGLKPGKEADSLSTAVLLDQQGHFPKAAFLWKTWDDFPVCIDPYNQEYNRIAYDQIDGTFLIVWNDYRLTTWDGSYVSEPGWSEPPADIFGQRLWIDPTDSAMVLLDHDGNPGASPAENTPIAFSEQDEGDRWYPAISFGFTDNQFLITYQYEGNEPQQDIYANLYNGAPSTTTGVYQPMSAKPAEYTLQQNYPNPFNPATEISYEIKKQGKVILEIFNSLGQKVTTLCEREHSPGTYHVTWPGRDSQGRQLPSGVYLYRLRINDQAISKKMLLLK